MAAEKTSDNRNTSKTTEEKSIAAANTSTSHQKERNDAAYQLTDNRPVASVQNSLHTLVNNSQHVKQLKAYHTIANNNSHSQKTLQRKEVANPVNVGPGVIQLWDNAEMKAGLEAVAEGGYQLNREVHLTNAIEAAATKATTAEKASYLASQIKVGQVFNNGNTRAATAAVYRVYNDAGDKELTVSPLQVLAAVGVTQLDDEFDFSAWMTEQEQESDNPIAIPGKGDLDAIHDNIAVIGRADSLLQALRGRYNLFKTKNLTRAEAVAAFQGDPELQRGYDSFEEYYDDQDPPVVETAQERDENFVGTLNDLHTTIWENQDKVTTAHRLIKPAGNRRFANTIEAGPAINALSGEELITRLNTIMGIPEEEEEEEEEAPVAEEQPAAEEEEPVEEEEQAEEQLVNEKPVEEEEEVEKEQEEED
ncbi:MAG: hypothetical protein K0S33_1534 [Bacteroidetes bacterium]|nr:hypothetical protein [Bacteroidota bacterium]